MSMDCLGYMPKLTCLSFPQPGLRLVSKAHGMMNGVQVCLAFRVHPAIPGAGSPEGSAQDV